MSVTPYPLAVLAHTVHDWGGNVLAIRAGAKKPAHPWKRYQAIRQTAAEVDGLPWGAADRIGIVNGISGIRSFDIDDSTSYGPVLSLLSALGLPEDYRWVEQSESGTGWHVWIVCEGEIPGGVLSRKEKDPGVFFGASADGSFDHLELRWENSQTIIASSAGVSRWLSGPPDAMPARVSTGAVLNAFLQTTKREPVSSESLHREPQSSPSSSAGGGDQKEEIRNRFDLVEFAQLRFGGETQRDPDGQVRVLGNGGLLFDLKRGVWYRFNGDVGGDCFDLAGLAIYGEGWNRADKRMFRAAFAEAAAFAGIATEATRIHRERVEEAEAVISPEGKRYRLYTATEIKERPAVTFRVEGLIPERALVGLVGNPGTYKTFIALDLALSIATGASWHGRSVEQGRILFISAEGAAGLGQRIRAWEAKHYRTVDDEHFRVITDAPLLLHDEDVEALVLSVSEAMESPQGIFIDTLARTFDGEENSSQDMGAYIRACDLLRTEFNCFVCPIHHLNKAGISARGSGAFFAALDVEVTLTRNEDLVTMAVTKAKDFIEGEPMTFTKTVIDLGKHVTSLVLETKVPNNLVPSAIETQILGILKDVFGAEGTTSSGWEKACAESGIGHSQFNRAKTGLLNRRLVKAPPGGEYVRGWRYTPMTIEGTKVPTRYHESTKPSSNEGTKVPPFKGGGTLVPSNIEDDANANDTEEEEDPDGPLF